MRGFWEDLFDFNHDGVVDLGEEFIGMVMMEDGYRELQRENSDPLDDPEYPDDTDCDSDW